MPELFGWRVGDENYVFIYMELIEGPTLEEYWEHLSIIEKKSILDQLSRIIENLRRLAQDPSNQFIGILIKAELSEPLPLAYPI